VLEAAGDLGLDEETESAGGVVGAVVEHLLESDFAVELGIKRDEDGAQAALGVRPEDAEPLSIGGVRAHGIGAGAVGVFVVRRALRRADLPPPCSIRPFWRASRPKNRSRDGSVGWDMVVARDRFRVAQ